MSFENVVATVAEQAKLSLAEARVVGCVRALNKAEEECQEKIRELLGDKFQEGIFESQLKDIVLANGQAYSGDYFRVDIRTRHNVNRMELTGWAKVAGFEDVVQNFITVTQYAALTRKKVQK